MEKSLEIQCLRDFRKYADTVAVSAAICHLFKKNKELGIFIGFEPKLKRIAQDPLTPDLVALYDNLTKGIIFEIKWSLPQTKEWLEKELKKLKKYFDTFINWKNATGRVDWHDLVLICHPDDAESVLDMIEKITKQSEYYCFKEVGFSIWTWYLNPPKSGERAENITLRKLYGSIRNVALEEQISKPTGIIIPEEILTHLRFTYLVIKEKPPIQYLLMILIIHVLPNPRVTPYDIYYEVDTDWIWKRARKFFSMGEEYDERALQFKRRWIREALEKLIELEIIERGKRYDHWRIPIRILPSRRPIQEVICKKLAKEEIKTMKKLKRRKPHPIIKYTKKPKTTGKERKITDFIKKIKNTEYYTSCALI